MPHKIKTAFYSDAGISFSKIFILEQLRFLDIKPSIFKTFPVFSQILLMSASPEAVFTELFPLLQHRTS